MTKMEYTILGHRNIVHYFVDFVKVWSKLEIKLLKKGNAFLLSLEYKLFSVMLSFLELLLKHILSEFPSLALKTDANCLRCYILNTPPLLSYIVFDFIVFGIIFFSTYYQIVAPTVTIDCMDQLHNCDEYQRDLCTNPLYRLFREQNCRKYCRICKGKSCKITVTCIDNTQIKM